MKGQLFLSGERHAGCPLFTKVKKVGQGSSKSFTYTVKVSYVRLVDFLWNVPQRRSHGVLLPVSRGMYGEAVNLLVGDCKPCHRPFPGQVTVL